MQFFPALDIKDGKCVRLHGGNLDECKVYETSALDAVYKYNLNRANWLHIVDLDGAAAGVPRNMSVIANVIKAVDCRVQIGGGIRDLNTIKQYLLLGATRVVLGTSALTDFGLISRASKRFFGRVALSLDTIGGRVALRGWTELSASVCEQVLAKLAHLKLSALIWTDVARDGTLSGVNTAELAKIVNISRLPVIVSGGVASLKDLKDLYANFGSSVAGVISGKAIYERVFNIEDAQRVLQNC
ncbi:1-(5-phosphoribosyl)-5-[(5- phosphoribosylamino)methylideneamino] imidazole-4-carboxamide isomerase [Candidatus Hodgkinia cicadicola]|nr:1-(5-phosphoribosyl)-5-[(5- phosphoribosylamino)methylideneamino] imidazole-4-carboxamide isomerase [Candidatus Hodgkinia cicadicola]